MLYKYSIGFFSIKPTIKLCSFTSFLEKWSIFICYMLNKNNFAVTSSKFFNSFIHYSVCSCDSN